MTKRAVAVFIKDNKILLLRRIKNGEEYFVFPGGGVEKGESVKDAVIREMKEELGLDIEISKLIFKFFNKYDSGSMNYFYLVREFTGIPKLGGPEKERMNKDNQYYPQWKSLNQLKELTNLYPGEAKRKFVDFYAINEKLKVFLEITKGLNKHFKVIPVLYGSLGLNRCIGEFGKAADIDILIPEKIIKSEWKKMISFMHKLGYKLKNTHEHEFTNEKEIIAFGLEENLTRDAGINLNELKRTELSGAKFKELSAKHFLKAYKFCLKDGYRQEKRGDADLKKIKLIRKYLKQNENI